MTGVLYIQALVKH